MQGRCIDQAFGGYFIWSSVCYLLMLLQNRGPKPIAWSRTQLEEEERIFIPFYRVPCVGIEFLFKQSQPV